MSLFAASSNASRHLLRHQLRVSNPSVAFSHARRSLSAAKGGGLRRTQNKGRRSSPTIPKAKSTQSQNATTSSTTPAAGGAASPLQQRDPHLIANEMVSSAITNEGRTSGVESVATLTKEQKLSNFAMAGGLLAFVSYIFYYSLASVGGGEKAKALIFGSNEDNSQQNAESVAIDEFLREANEGRTEEEKRTRAEQQARGEAHDLVELESSTAARLKAEGLSEDVIVAGSANEEEEREMARVAGFVEGGEGGGAAQTKRPLWKRVVFFWRRE